MGKFSAHSTGGKIDSLLPDFDPYAEVIKDVEKVQDKTTGTVGPTQEQLTTPQPAGTPGVVPADVQQTPEVEPVEEVRSPVVQPTEDIQRPETRDQLIQQVQETGSYDQDGNYIPISREEATKVVDEDLAAQEELGYQPIDLGFESAKDIQQQTTEKSQANLSSVGQKGAQAVADTGLRTYNAISNRLDNVLDSPENIQGTAFLKKYNLVNNNGKVSRRLGNAVALAIPALIKDEFIKRAEEKTDVDTDLSWADDEISADRPEFNPSLTQGNLIGEILNIIDPIKSDNAFYDKESVESRGKDAGASQVEAAIWQALKDDDLVEVYYPDPANKNDIRFRWSTDAVNYYKGTEKIMQVINPKLRIAPSKFAPPVGHTYGKELLSKSAKQISNKAKVDKNQKIANAVKDTLSKMPISLNQNNVVVAKLLWEDVAGKLDDATGISSSPYAHLFRLDSERYDKFRIETLSKLKPEELRLIEADPTLLQRSIRDKMKEEADKLGKDFKDIDEQGPEQYFNKWFHAGANGRYHVLNNVLDYQSSKLIRNLVQNARTVSFVPGKGGNLEENWKYIIARNIRPKVNGVKVTELGWNRTLADIDPVIKQAATFGEILANPTHPKYKQTLDAVLTNPNNTPDNENWGAIIQSYVDTYNYAQALKEGKSFSPKAQTQHDGIQNGPAIQGVQQGLKDVLERVGLSYQNDELKTIDNGDIRSYFTNAIESGVVKNVFIDNPPLAQAWETALASITDKKDIAKGPVTETAYGKWHEYHADTAYKFIQKHSRPGLGYNLKDTILSTDPKRTEAQLVRDLNSIISGALQVSFDTPHQLRLKRVGDLWSSLGITPVIQGPLGNYIYFGSKTFNPEFDTQGATEEVVFQSAQGPIVRRKGSVGASTAGKPLTKRVRDAATGEVVDAEQRVGSIVPNQLPVLTVQHIDSAVLSDMLLRVNQNRQGKVPLHVLPIHDAIITDASSVREYHQQINKSFVDINKGYNIAKEVQTGLRNAIRQWEQSINPDGGYNIHPHVGQYRSLFSLVNQIWERSEQAKEENKRPSASGESVLKFARAAGINPDPATYINQANYIKGKQLVNLMKQLDIHLQATNGLKSWIKTIENNQKVNFDKIRKRTYQYN